MIVTSYIWYEGEVAEEDCRAIEETLYLAAIPGMRDSIKKGLRPPFEKSEEEPSW